ncbi:MAG: hypothetical protein WCH05_05485 [Chlorobiaceae bacterium]
MATINMKSPDGIRTVFVGGKTYEAGASGIIEVPGEHEETMYAFGFLTIGKNLEEVLEPEAGKVEKKKPNRQSPE